MLKRIITVAVALFLLAHYIVVVYYSINIRAEFDKVMVEYEKSPDGLVFADVTYDYQASPLAWKKPYFEIFTYDWVMYWKDKFYNDCNKQMRVIPTCLRKADELKGNHIYLDVVSVGATINVMLASIMAEGVTIIENAAKEPHVVDVANFLNSMGANIKGAGTDVIRVRGVERLHGTEYAIIPDQIEAGTFMFAAAVTKGDVTVKNVIPKHLESISAKLLEIGCEVEESDDAVRVVAAKPLTHTHVKTLPYPGFPTDMQPQITVALALSSGTSIVTESIFENRFKYVDELTRMGANIKVEGSVAIVDGVKQFTGAQLVAPDLRAGAALVMAGLAAEGYTTVSEIEYIERGYENFVEKLRLLGANIEQVDSEKEAQKFRLRVG